MGSLPDRVREDALDAFREADSGAPLTTDEVAAELDASRETARIGLESLAEEGNVASKRLGDERVWWLTDEGRNVGDSTLGADLERAQFDELVETVTDYAIFVIDADGYIDTWNDGARRIKGYEESEILGEHFSTFYTEEDREAGRPERNLERAAEDGRVEDEGWRVRKDGTRFWANVVITALYDGDELRGYLKVTRDMTERREYEQRLRQEKERFETLVREVKNYAIFLVDTDGRIQTWNEGARELKGYDKAEIIGEHIATFYTEDDQEAGRPERNLERAAEDGRVEDEGWRVRKDGSRFWANVVITALYDDGELRGYAKVTRDMTERHEYEQALENERERLEFMNRIIRHNILNGLNVVAARAEISQSLIPDDHEAREHLETVRTRVEDLSALIDTMRKFMNAIVSDEDHETTAIPLREEIAKKVSLSQDSYPDAVFETHDLPDASTRVFADELVSEVFENVLSNAVVHNDADVPRVEVWATETTHDADVDAETGEVVTDARAGAADADVVVREWPAIAVHVGDNGPGVSDEQKEAILEKGVSNVQEPGSGFGLYLVEEMMNAYGGYVDVRDRDDGDGAVFTLVFLKADDAEGEA